MYSVSVLNVQATVMVTMVIMPMFSSAETVERLS